MRSARILLTGSVVLSMLAAIGCRKEEEAPPPEEKVEKVEAKKPEPPPAPKVPGVSDTEIVIGTTSPQTGPAALWGSVARGTACYFDMINEAGGINGRKLKLEIRDDGYQPARTVAATKELVEQVGVFAMTGGIGTATGLAVKDYLAEKKVPWVGQGTGSTKMTDPMAHNLFAMFPTYNDEAHLLVKYITENLKKKKIAFFYQNDDYGKEALEGARKALEAKKLKLAAEVSVEVTDTDLASHVMKLKKAKPQVVILWLMPKHAAITMGTAAKLKFKPQWITGSTLSDAAFMHKITKGAWEGVHFDSFFELPDSEHPLIAKYKAAYDKFALKRNDKELWSTFFIAGFLFAEPLVEAIKNAGPELTREKVIAELEKLDKWGGGLHSAVTFGKDNRRGVRSVYLAKCEKGKAVKTSGYITFGE